MQGSYADLPSGIQALVTAYFTNRPTINELYLTVRQHSDLVAYFRGLNPTVDLPEYIHLFRQSKATHQHLVHYQVPGV